MAEAQSADQPFHHSDKSVMNLNPSCLGCRVYGGSGSDLLPLTTRAPGKGQAAAQARLAVRGRLQRWAVCLSGCVALVNLLGSGGRGLLPQTGLRPICQDGWKKSPTLGAQRGPPCSGPWRQGRWGWRGTGFGETYHSFPSTRALTCPHFQSPSSAQA